MFLCILNFRNTLIAQSLFPMIKTTLLSGLAVFLTLQCFSYVALSSPSKEKYLIRLDNNLGQVLHTNTIFRDEVNTGFKGLRV
jgi:hypothetical protein